MFTALDKNTNKIVFIEEALGTPSEYVCPICNTKLIIKNGNVVTPHFAHESNLDCDSFSSDMSKWHRDWQKRFPRKNQEVVLKWETTEEYLAFMKSLYYGSHEEIEEARKKWLGAGKNEPLHKTVVFHRADVCACGYVIEFQHSPLSNGEFGERCSYYEKLDFKTIWIFDVRDKVASGNMRCYGNSKYGDKKWSWRYASKTLRDFTPQDEDTKESTAVFFQTDDDTLEMVVWAPEREGPDGRTYTDFSTFITSKSKQLRVSEFYDCVKNRRL